MLRTYNVSSGCAIRFSGKVTIKRRCLTYSGRSHVVCSFIPRTFLGTCVRTCGGSRRGMCLVVRRVGQNGYTRVFKSLFRLLSESIGNGSRCNVGTSASLETFLRRGLNRSGRKVGSKRLYLPSGLCVCTAVGASSRSLFPVSDTFGEH